MELVGTTVGSDRATTYTCGATGYLIDLSTAPPKPTSKAAVPPLASFTPLAASLPPAPYQTGTCDLHILETSSGANLDLYTTVEIIDDGGNTLANHSSKGAWGDSVTIKSDNSQLPYDVVIVFLASATIPSKPKMIKGRIIGPVEPLPMMWEKWVLTVTAGDTSWDSTVIDKTHLPYCSVGSWDNGNLDDSASPVSNPYSIIQAYANLKIEPTNGLLLDMLIVSWIRWIIYEVGGI